MEATVVRVLSQVGLMLDARFAAVEGRLLPERSLRPPLGVKSTNGNDRARAPQPPPSTGKVMAKGPAKPKEGKKTGGLLPPPSGLREKGAGGRRRRPQSLQKGRRCRGLLLPLMKDGRR